MDDVATSYDTIIVGAGSAGCVLAARLTEDADRQVLLVEAGPDYPTIESLPADIADGGRVPDTHDWGFHAESGSDGAGLQVPRGRIVGGSSAVNACFALRGHPGDYDAWAASGNFGWSFTDVLPAFAAIERDLDFGDRPGHGDQGALPIRRYPDAELNPLHQAFLDAAMATGHPGIDDHNAPGAIGAGRLPTNCVGGLRISAALAFLAPVRSRPNLHLRPDTLVDRIQVRHGRATAIILADGERIPAGQVVLAAGTYASPLILLRSGIGRSDDLRPLGIDPVLELPGVGRGLLDHPAISLNFPAPADSPLHPTFQSMVTFHSHTTDDAGPPDLQTFAGGAWSDDSSPTGRVAAVIAALVKPVSRGHVTLGDAAPATPPRINLAHLAEPADLAALIDGLRRARQIAIKLLDAGMDHSFLSSPPPEVWGSDTALGRWITRHAWSYHHPVGTCAMGSNPDAGAVVSTDGRVHGLDRLAVVDASIMPDIPSANTNLPTLMIAHRLASRL